MLFGIEGLEVYVPSLEDDLGRQFRWITVLELSAQLGESIHTSENIVNILKVEIICSAYP